MCAVVVVVVVVCVYVGGGYKRNIWNHHLIMADIGSLKAISDPKVFAVKIISKNSIWKAAYMVKLE